MHIIQLAEKVPDSKELKMLLLLLHVYTSKFQKCNTMKFDQIKPESIIHLDPSLKRDYKKQLELFEQSLSALNKKAQ